LNQGPLACEASALTGLSYASTGGGNYRARAVATARVLGARMCANAFIHPHPAVTALANRIKSRAGRPLPEGEVTASERERVRKAGETPAATSEPLLSFSLAKSLP
jgi:hypothetical protein